MKWIDNIRERILKRIISRYAKDKNNASVELGRILGMYENASDYYVGYKLYPKYTDKFIPSQIQSSSIEGEVAIVLQGPVETKNNFTIESIKLYKIIFPKAQLIVSTWDDTPSVVIESLSKQGVHLVINKTFKPNGFANVNYQIVTSLAGIKKAKELGAKYVLKVRSDWRIYYEHSIDYLKALMTLFPVDPKNKCQLQGRIINGGGGRANFCMPFWLQDFMYFGYTSDLINFFSIPLDERQIDDRIAYATSKLGPHHNGKAIATLLPPEIYMTSNFLKKHIKNQELNYMQHWDNMKKYFLTINPEDINAFWLKYDKLRDFTISDFYQGRNQSDAYKMFKFQDWANIYTSQYVYKPEYEKICESRIL